MYYDIANFFTICRRTYRIHRQCYGSEKFSQHYSLIKSGPFQRSLNRSNADKLVINSTSGCNYKNYKLSNNNYKLKNSLT